MRRVSILLFLLFAGCKPGRQAAVSNAGLVASTVDDGGTFVAGRGRVVEGGTALAFSPDGTKLAIAGPKRVVLWPSGGRIAGMSSPLAWSPDGAHLAGEMGTHVVVREIATGRIRKTTMRGVPERLHWGARETLVGFDRFSIQVDGGPTVQMKPTWILDAVILADGRVAFVGYDAAPESPGSVLQRSIVRGEWDPTTGAVKTESTVATVDLFGTAVPGRLDVPLRFAQAPDGRAFVAAALRVEASPTSLARLRTLADEPNPTSDEKREMEARLKAARLTSVVVRVDDAGRTTTLWRAAGGKDDAVTDLTFSPDGRWLAIALPSRTERLAL